MLTLRKHEDDRDEANPCRRDRSYGQRPSPQVERPLFELLVVNKA